MQNTARVHGTCVPIVASERRLQDFSPEPRLALWAVLNVRPKGILFMAPVCSSWVFMNRGTARRDWAQPLGAAHLPHVSAGNLMTCRVALLCAVARWRGVYWMFEQPGSSLMVAHPAIQALLQQQTVHRVSFCMGAFGATSLKPSHLYSNASWLAGLEPQSHHSAPSNPLVVWQACFRAF